jgi:hypothetical protein
VRGDAGFIEAEYMLARMKRLPVRLRIAHLVALLRREREVRARERSNTNDGGRAG